MERCARGPEQIKPVVPVPVGNLANGTFVGVLSYPLKAGDYRGQAVRVGTYVLRYQTLPMDGNHLGVAPGTNFLLLLPNA